MSFHEVQFPTNISQGARGGPRRKTQIVALAGGNEERNASWLNSRRAYDIGYGIRSADAMSAVVAFFEARNGQLFGFRFKDWSDYKSCLPSQTLAPTDQLIGLGNGVATTFQLKKSYASGGTEWLRPITKPVVGTLRITTTIADGPELVPDWDNPRTANWSYESIGTADDASTYAGFTHAKLLGVTGIGVWRNLPGAPVTPGVKYRCSMWMKEGSDTEASFAVRSQPVGGNSTIRGPYATPAIYDQNAGAISNITSTNLGGGVWLWTMDVVPIAGATLLDACPGNRHSAQTIIFFGASIRRPGSTGETTAWTLDSTTGIVTFDMAPANGAEVRAGFEFDVPVRFDADMIDVALKFERLGSIASIPLIEVKS